MLTIPPSSAPGQVLTPGPPAAATIRLQISVLSSCRFPPTMNSVPVVLEVEVQEVVMEPQVQEPHCVLRTPQLV